MTDDRRTLNRFSIGWIFSLATVLAIFACGSLWFAQGQEKVPVSTPSADASLVVVELFTSEGCSSCPPADEILNGLLQRQPFQTITVLGLSEHVDYWNRDGWVDPFSSADFTKRQLNYRRTFQTNMVYTPQMVVDGHMEHVGNESRGVYRTILQASLIPKADLKLAVTNGAAAGALDVKVQVTIPKEIVANKADVMIAITEDDLAADVRGGENRGRKLKHNGVVRSLMTAGTLAPAKREWSGTTSIPLAPDWKPANLKVIAFLQEQESRRIIANGWSKVGGLAAER